MATSFASTKGLRSGRMRMPVARRSVVVADAMYASHTSGSGIGVDAPPGILPEGLYGYADS
ncbi:unannotated protein [freshwater metagenome]|uniref:Unannotated protein n=1 Tax=freshwater metagenome TaxID=449393 RepID=A0A6J6RZE9_9ZZZZ